MRLQLLGAVLSAASGCIAQPDDTLRVHEELGRARAAAAWQQAHAAQLEAQTAVLESRISRLERTTDDNRSRSGEESQLLSRLERLLEVNERLLAERGAPPASGVPAPAGQKAVTTTPALATRTAALDNEAITPGQARQLRVLLESILASPDDAHRVLTREQENALRLLVRSGRKLDTQNPWPTELY